MNQRSLTMDRKRRGEKKDKQLPRKLMQALLICGNICRCHNTRLIPLNLHSLNSGRMSSRSAETFGADPVGSYRVDGSS